MKTEKHVVSCTKEEYDCWLSNILTHQTFATPAWLSSLPMPCSVSPGGWESGSAIIYCILYGIKEK